MKKFICYLIIGVLALPGALFAAECCEDLPPPLSPGNAAGQISTHSDDTTSVHGITDTSLLQVVNPTPYIHTDAAVVLTAANCYGNVNYNGDDDVIDFTLPVAAAGLMCCFDANGYSRIITVDTADGTDSIKLGGTSLTAGNVVDTSGGSGAQFCLAGRDTSTWIAYPGSAYLADGGAD